MAWNTSAELELFLIYIKVLKWQYWKFYEGAALDVVLSD